MPGGGGLIKEGRAAVIELREKDGSWDGGVVSRGLSSVDSESCRTGESACDSDVPGVMISDVVSVLIETKMVLYSFIPSMPYRISCS